MLLDFANRISRSRSPRSFKCWSLQLMNSDLLTVEQAEQVFDGAAKRSARLKEAAPDAQRLIQHLHDELNWDKYYKLAANRRRLRRKEWDLSFFFFFFFFLVRMTHLSS